MRISVRNAGKRCLKRTQTTALIPMELSYAKSFFFAQIAMCFVALDAVHLSRGPNRRMISQDKYLDFLQVRNMGRFTQLDTANLAFSYFIGECYFPNDELLRESWQIWAELDAQIDNFLKSESPNIQERVHISISRYAVYHSNQSELWASIQEAVRSSEAIGEILIWYLLLNRDLHITSVDKALKFTLESFVFFKPKYSELRFPTSRKKIKELCFRVRAVAPRCAAMRLIFQSKEVSFSMRDTKELISLTLTIEERLHAIFRKFSSKPFNKPNFFGQKNTWKVLPEWIRYFAHDLDGHELLDKYLDNTWQAEYLKDSPKEVGDLEKFFLRKQRRFI